jgi:hypothetical protein
MVKPALRMAAISVACLLVGCADTVFYTPLNESPRPLAPRSPESVEVISVTPPSWPHKDLGILQVEQRNPSHTVDELLAELRAEAATRGCDAILIISIDRRVGRYQAPSIQASCLIHNTAP